VRKVENRIKWRALENVALSYCFSETKTLSDYLNKLLTEGMAVLQSRIPSGHPIIYDQVDSMLFHKWALNCIGFLAHDAPEHVAQIRLVYKPDIALHHQAVQIFAILNSATEILRAKNQNLSREAMAEKPPAAFSLDFLTPRLVEKCTDHFRAAKYDDCILNAAKVVEVMVREAANLPAEDIGVQLMRKAFKPAAPLLKFSDVTAEQEAAMNLYCGFIGFFKNPHSHKFMNVKDPVTAFEILSMANHLCGMVANATAIPKPRPA
jgi:uncharacterized protein (TIGR02391 family)